MSKIILPTLETERLILRPLTVEDRDAIFKWTGDPRVNKYMIYPLYKKAEEVVDWVSTLYEDEKKLDYGFVLKSTGELIGAVAFIIMKILMCGVSATTLPTTTGTTATHLKQ